MYWIFYLIGLQILLATFVGIIRDISFKHYIKEKGYVVVKRPFLVKMSKTITSYLQIAIPFWGTLIVLTLLFVNEETFLKVCLKDGVVKRKMKQ